MDALLDDVAELPEPADHGSVATTSATIWDGWRASSPGPVGAWSALYYRALMTGDAVGEAFLDQVIAQFTARYAALPEGC